MAAAGKKGKKTKGKTLALNDFLADSPGGATQTVVVPRKSSNWADDVDNDDDTYYSRKEKVVLPTAPRATRSPDVDDEKIPHSPPFLAYISNLPYEVNEDEIADFFNDLNIVNVRLPRDDRQAGKLKGFGYVEFGNRDSLISALTMGDTMIKQRRMRIEVADNAENDRRRGGRDRDRDRDGPDRSSTDWRAGPRDDFGGADDRDRGFDRRGGGRRDFGSGGFRDGDRGFGGDRDRGFGGDRDRGFGGDRDRGFGGDRDRGFGGDRDRGFGSDRDRGFGGDRDRGFGGDRDRGFGGDRDRGFGGDRDRGFGSRDGDRGFGGRDGDRGFGGRDGDRGFGSRDGDRGFGSRDGDRDRGFGGRDFGGRSSGPGPRRDYDRDGRGRDDLPPRNDSDQKSRPRLNLQPRTRPVEEVAKPPPPAPSQSSIFGGAKPVDTAAREREIEERLAREKGDVATRPPPRDVPRSDDSRKDERVTYQPPARVNSRDRARRDGDREDEDEAREEQRSPVEPRHETPVDHDGRVSSPHSSDPEPEHAHRDREESPERKYQPPKDSNTAPRRQVSGEREERRGERSNPPRAQPPSKSADRSRPRETSEQKKDGTPSAENMPKYREQEAPVFVARNKFDFLADEEEDEGVGDSEQQ